MNTQKEFETALNDLSPQERQTYIEKNPNIGVSGSNLSYNPTSSKYEAITSESLKPAPIIDVTNPAPATKFAGIQGKIEAQTAASKADIQAEDEQKRQVELQKMKEDYSNDTMNVVNSLLGQDTKSSIIADEYSKKNDLGTTVNEKSSELRKINNEIEAEQYALRKRLEALDKNPNGLFGGALEDEKARIEKESVSKQADLYIKKLGIQGDYESAKSIADQLVEARYEKQQNEIDAAKFEFQNTKDLYTKEEQRVYEETWYKKQQELDKEKEEAKSISDMALKALENGAPSLIASQMRNAKTVDEAMRLGGQYLVKSDGLKAPEVKEINGVDMQWNQATGKWEKIDSGGANVMSLAQAEGNVQLIDSVVNSSALKSAVGPNSLSRFSWTNWATGGKSNFIAGVEQLTSQLTLDSLIAAKARGATFGALSDSEMKILASSASKINSWAVKDENNRVVGYKTSEKAFRQEMDRINNYAKLDYLNKGGSPENVGVSKMDDGTYWTQNSDGTMTQIM